MTVVAPFRKNFSPSPARERGAGGEVSKTALGIQGQALALLRHKFHNRSRIIGLHVLQRLGATNRWTTCRRMAGSVGRCVDSSRRGFIFGQPHVNEEREGD